MSVNMTLAVWTIVAFSYFVILKRSPIGALGYRVAGVRIAGLDGRPAGWLPITLRLMFAVLGPLIGAVVYRRYEIWSYHVIFQEIEVEKTTPSTHLC